MYGTVLEEKLDAGDRLEFLGNDSFVDMTEDEEPKVENITEENQINESELKD